MSGCIVGWQPDSTAIAYARQPDESEQRELHLVTLTDATDRVVAVADQPGDMAWAESDPVEPGTVVPATSPPRPPRPSGTPTRDAARRRAAAARRDLGSDGRSRTTTATPIAVWRSSGSQAR